MSPRYYEYISRLAPVGQQGTYMGFAFLPLGIGSLIGGKFGGFLIHHFGEVKHEPAGMWWVIIGVGVRHGRFAVGCMTDFVLRGKPPRMKRRCRDPPAEF